MSSPDERGQAVSEQDRPQTLDAKRRMFQGELFRRISDPGRVGAPGSSAEMLRSLAHVVLDEHELSAGGYCTSCVSVRGSLAEEREWPCVEVVRMGRIYGVWWTGA